MARHPTDVGFAELHNEHLEFGGVLASVSFETLTHGLDAFKDICIAVGCLMVLFEGLEKDIERGERFDIFIRVNVPYLRVAAKPSTGKTSLNLFGDRGEFHIFFGAERPGCDGAKGRVRSIKFFGLGYFEGFWHGAG